MSLQRRLVITLSIGLLASLLVGVVLTYLHAVAKVRTEMVAALAVARHHVENQLDDGKTQIEPARLIAQIVSGFNGDRHLRAVLLSPAGTVLMSSTPLPPDGPAPRAFYDLVAGPTMQADVALPSGFPSLGQLRLENDPHSEVAEAWSDLKLMLSMLALFFAIGLGLMIWIVRRALAPLRDLCLGFGRIGAGEYDARVMTMTYRELAPVQQGFNDMASRLARMEGQNRSLQAQIQRVQEEERAEMARDLHDEIAPFLFSVGTDAALIQQFMQTRSFEYIDDRAVAIINSVRHMQRHLKTVLSRLMPNALVDLSLPGAIEELVAFWKARRPAIEFSVCASEEPADDRSRSVIFRVVQESLSNAVRHGAPSRIRVHVGTSGDTIEVEISDNGRGLPATGGPPAFGLIGMQERVRSVGGTLSVESRAKDTGVTVRALLPREPQSVGV